MKMPDVQDLGKASTADYGQQHRAKDAAHFDDFVVDCVLLEHRHRRLDFSIRDI